MADSIQELATSEPTSKGNANAVVEKLYFIENATDRDDAYAELKAECAPSSTETVDGEDLPLQDYDLQPLTNNNWLGTVTYARVAPDPGRNQATGESYYNFEITGKSTHVTHSLDTPHTLGGAQDHEGAINVVGNGPEKRIEGTDVIFPEHVFSETHYISDATVDASYKSALADLTGKTNNATFRGFAVGEVLFLGASGSKRGAGNYEITFRFGVRPNDGAFAVTGIAGTVAKEGWEYAWVESSPEVSASGKAEMRNRAAYIEQIYASGDFTTLGI